MLREAKKQLTLCSLLDSGSVSLCIYVLVKSSYKSHPHHYINHKSRLSQLISQNSNSPLLQQLIRAFTHNRLSIILTLIIHLRIKSMASKPMQDCDPCPPPAPPNPRKVLENIYGSRFMRNSKQLTPLNISAQAKNSVGGVSSDYYTFQHSLANSKNKNPERPAEKFRKTFHLAKPSTTQLMTPATSRNMLAKYKSTNPRTEVNNRSSAKLIMNNTSTGFNNGPKTPDKPSYNMNLLHNTAQNFRPPTNSYMRQCNNQAEDHNNYLSKYEIIKQLGKGTYGVVHLARKKLPQTSRSPRKLDDSFLFAYGTQKKERQEHQTTLEFPEHSTTKIIVSDSQGKKKQHDNSINQGSLQEGSYRRENKQTEPDLRQSRNLPVPEKSLMESSEIHKDKLEKQNEIEKKSIEVQNFDQSQQLFAIKIYEKFKMNKDPTKFKNIRKEINIMQNIKHSHIIKLFETVETLTKISLVVEYGGKQSLLDYLKDNYPLSEPVMRKIGSQLLSALQYLHEKNIVHRDIKLQNILMLNGDVKIIDFGFSTLTYKNRKLNAICGTPNYMAPEVLAKKQYIGELADIWSYGVVMFTIAEGRHPFKAETYNDLERLVNKGVYQFRKITNPVHQSFIKRILKIKPQDRPRACDLINHAWLAMKEDSNV